MSARSIVALLCVAIAGPWVGSALAQPAADLNPAVNTSAPQPPPADAAAGPAVQSAVSTAPPSTDHASAAPAAGGQQAQAAHADPAQPAPVPAATSAPAPAANPGSAGSSDRIELGTTEISGNRELPKLMYIVPWQRAAVGKVTGRPPNSLVDEALTPVDRSVFGRQNGYYAALQAASASAASQPQASAASPVAAVPRDEK